MAVERKYERDIDILLAEEFSVSPEFARWFWQHTRFCGIEAKVVDVFVSRSDSTGESDLVVLYESVIAGGRFALMIEDKLDAPLQPEQEARYRLRGKSEVASGAIEDFEVILCSPESYSNAIKQTSSFDSVISHESIGLFLRENAVDQRGIYRANFVATAATRNANSWTRIADEVTNGFWKAAYEIAAKEFPILEMKALNVTKDSTWINFRPHDMPTLPRRIYVSVKGDRGHMDLTFTNSTAHIFHSEIESILDLDMTVHQTGKSAAIRLCVPGFRVSEPWETSAVKIREAFSASEKLIRFFRTNRPLLERAAYKSVPAAPPL